MHLPRHAEIWLPGYVKDRLRAWGREPVKRVWLTFADHFEPLWNRADEKTAIERVKLWSQHWPRIASRFADCAGRPPRYTFFYPEEEYRPHLLSQLEPLVEAGIADVEIHIHHDGEGEQNFVDRMSSFIETLRIRHGLLRTQNGRPVFGFIHGLWALDNSRPDGRWCGLNNEITLLRDLGCYADFTLPSAPHATQVELVNTIYWATDDPARPKSHNNGVTVTPGRSASGDLLLIPGPLTLARRPGKLLPRLDTGELAWYDAPAPERVRAWLDDAPRVGNSIFLKLFSHGAQEPNSQLLLFGGLDQCLSDLTAECARRQYRLRYVNPWEMRTEVDRLQTVASSQETSKAAVRQ